jgi:hypothetical protein
MDFVKTADEKEAEAQAKMQSPEYLANQEMLVHTVQAAALKNKETDARTRKIEADAQHEQDKLDLEGVKLGSEIAAKSQQQESANAVQGGRKKGAAQKSRKVVGKANGKESGQRQESGATA